MRARPTCIAGWLLLATAVLAQAPTGAVAPKMDARARPAITADIVSARMEKFAPNHAALTIATKPDANLRLHDSSGKEVPITRLADGSLKAEVDPTRGYVLVPPPQPRKSLTKEGLQLPARYVTFAPSGKTNLGGLFLRPAAVPLTWNKRAEAYTTEIFVGYEFEDGREDTLAAKKTVAFFVEGANARIQENTVVIERSGPAGYKPVTLFTGQLDGETNFTARASALDELKSSVTVQREPGALKLSLPSTELPAFGVGSGVLTVSLLARDAMPLRASVPLEVQLSSRRLRQPPVLVIEAGKSTATAEFRTAGYGVDEIVAQSGAFQGSLPVKLIFPVAAVVAAVLGGALGGSARYLRNKGKRGKLLLRRVMEGVLVGLIIVGAVWAGLVTVDVSSGILGTPFGALVLGALAGYLGCIVLDRVANKTFGPPKAEP